MRPLKALGAWAKEPGVVLPLTLVVVLVLFLAGCAPSSGTVIDKDYDDADHYMGTCYHTKTRTVPRTTTINGTTTTTMRVETYQEPYSCPKFDPERYSLHLDDGESDGWISVPPTTYEQCAIRDYYSDEKKGC